MKKLLPLCVAALLALGSLLPAALAEGERVAIVCEPLGGSVFLAQTVDKAELLKDVFGYELSVLECPDEASWTRSYISAADAGCALIVGIGRQAAANAAAMAGERPGEIALAVIDADAGSEGVSSYVYNVEQSAYVLGVMAAEAFPEAVRFGCLGGFEGAESWPARWGFAEGVRSVRPEAEFAFAYAEGDPDRAHDLALDLAEQGCAFIMGGAAAGNAGLFEAARERTAAGAPLYVSGQDTDDTGEDAPWILSSQLKNGGVTLAFIIDNFYAGTLVPGLTVLDIASGTVGVANVTSEGAWRNRDVLTDGVIGICQAVVGRIADGDLALEVPPEG